MKSNGKEEYMCDFCLKKMQNVTHDSEYITTVYPTLEATRLSATFN